ncbi:MAG: hypothetical protein NUK62_06930 [Tenericutes bacterium]|nr:hypothetical protein [Mycoplasmatota bacterium]
MGWLSQLLSLVVALLFSTLVSYAITYFLIRIHKKLYFLLPVFFVIFSAILWGLGFLSDDWGALGYMLYGAFALIAAVGSFISSMILWKNAKKKST